MGREVHVAPIEEDGRIDESHDLNCFCACMPEVDFVSENGVILIVHNEIIEREI